MPPLKDLTGMTFGRLTVLERAGSDKFGKVMWLCQCDCGNTAIMRGASLRSGNTKSCGCLTREISIEHNTRHGLSQTRLYRIWRNMKERTSKPQHKSYKAYGGRGITVCEEWHRFEPFAEWALANGYQDELSLDRKNNELGYYPENCRWVNTKEQANNKRNNHFITYQGQKKSLTQWAEEYQMAPVTLSKRLRSGWTIEEALTTPVDERYSRKKK